MRKLMLIGPILLMLLLAWTPGISFTEDLGRHLLLGQIISETGSVPETNLLTYTHPDFPFVNHHWLSEVILYQLHHVIGLNGLIIWKMLMMTAALSLALLAVKPERASATYWLTGILAAVMMAFRAHIRPELLTYIFIAAYLFLFEQIRGGKRWPRWALLIIAPIWANAHIYFVFGLGMLFLFAVERWWQDRTQRTGLHETSWFLGALLLSCINPNGLKGFLYPFTIFRNYGIGITENASPFELWSTVLNPMLIALPLISLITIIAVIIEWRRHALGGERHPLRLANLLIVLTSLIATWMMARSAPLLALTALPVVAAATTGETGNSKLEIGKENRFPISNFKFLPAFIFNLGLCFAVVEGSYTRPWPSPIGPTPFGFDDESRYRRLREQREDHGLRGPVFTDYNIGSLVEYQLYPEPGYVDNRPEAFPAAFWRTEYIPALALGTEWAEVRDRRNINTIIVSLPGVKEGFCRELMRRPLWLLVHLDALSGVWVRNSVDNKSVIDACLFKSARISEYEQSIADRIAALPEVPWWRRQTEVDALVYSLYSLICIDQTVLVWPHLKKIYEMYPDYQIVHELMRATVYPEDVEMAEHVMEKRARWPVAAKQVLDWGNYLMAKGRIDEAGSVFVRGRFFFPLSTALKHAVTEAEDLAYRSRLQ